MMAMELTEFELVYALCIVMWSIDGGFVSVC